MLVIVPDRIQECGLICPFVRAGFISPIVILLHLLCQESLNTFLCFLLLLILSIFAKHISQIFYSPPLKYFSEQILVALARNPVNILVIVLESI